jgi:serine/threonine-protein kinase
LPPGTVIAEKYRVVRRLGVGGMGAVYEAANTWTGRRVAVKLLHPTFAADADVVRRFALEAQISAQLEHPAVVDVLDLGRADDGALFIVQEFLDGCSLSELVGHGKRLAPRQAVEIMLVVLDAVGFAHSRGVVHRDLKPGNIFLARDARGETTPKVIDFGITKVLGGPTGTGEHTQTGVVLGTPGYLSPEQALGDNADIDQRADLWALGAVLFMSLAGRAPFVGETPTAVIAQILTLPAPDVRTVAPNVPADLAAVVQRALAHDRDARFTSAQEFARALLACEVARGLPLVPHSVHLSPSAPFDAANTQSPTDMQWISPDQSVRGSARRSWLRLGFVVAVVLSFAAAAVVVFRTPSASPSASAVVARPARATPSPTRPPAPPSAFPPRPLLTLQVITKPTQAVPADAGAATARHVARPRR